MIGEAETRPHHFIVTQPAALRACVQASLSLSYIYYYISLLRSASTQYASVIPCSKKLYSQVKDLLAVLDLQLVLCSSDEW